MGTIRSRCALEDSKRPSWPRWTGDKTGTPHDRSRPRARGVRTTGRGGVFRLRVENSHLPMDRIHSGVCEASRSRAGPCHSSERILPDIGRPLRRRVRGGFSPPSVPPRESRRRTDQDGLTIHFVAPRPIKSIHGCPSALTPALSVKYRPPIAPKAFRGHRVPGGY